MPTSRAGTSTEAGFTLIELAVVIVLIGVLLGLVVPRIPGVGRDRLEMTAQHIAGLTRYLYNEAALTGQEHHLRIDFKANRIGGMRLEEDGELQLLEGTGRGRVLPEPVRVIDVVRGQGGKQTSGSCDVRILPMGWVEDTVIHLTGDHDRMLTLHLQSLTGLTDIYDGYREF